MYCTIINQFVKVVNTQVSRYHYHLVIFVGQEDSFCRTRGHTYYICRTRGHFFDGQGDIFCWTRGHLVKTSLWPQQASGARYQFGNTFKTLYRLTHAFIIRLQSGYCIFSCYYICLSNVDHFSN